MSKLDEKVKEFAKPASSVKHSRKIAFIVTRADMAESDTTLKQQLRQNKEILNASWIEGKDKIVK